MFFQKELFCCLIIKFITRKLDSFMDRLNMFLHTALFSKLFPTFMTRIINFHMDGVNMFIETPLFCKNFVTLKTVLGPLWMRLKCSFWLFFIWNLFHMKYRLIFFCKSFSQNDITNSSNVWAEKYSWTWSAGKCRWGGWSCDKCKSWLVTRSDLVSHHTSTHKQACNIRIE